MKTTAAACLTTIFASSTLLSQTANLQADRCNTLYEDGLGSLSAGASPGFFVGATGRGQLRRGLIHFPVATGVPAGATVTGATLTLTCTRTNSGDMNIKLHRALANWGSGSSVTDPFSGGGGGAASTDNDATWIHTFYTTAIPGGGTQLWANPGGDFDSVSVASTPVGLEGVYSWTSSDLKNLVQSWLDQPANNFGLVLVGVEGTPGSAKRFETQLTSTVTDRPVLAVTYTLPTFCVADLGVQGGTPGRDGVLDNNDFVAFIDLFFAQNAAADLGVQGGGQGSDGAWDNNDFVAFIDAFFLLSGCP